MLCTGSELGRLYVRALKNVSFNRSYSADVMLKVASLLGALGAALSTGDKAESWRWVSTELDKVQCLLSLKTSADEQFKGRQFKAALMKYTNCLKVSECLVLIDRSLSVQLQCLTQDVVSVHCMLVISVGPQCLEVECDHLQQSRGG